MNEIEYKKFLKNNKIKKEDIWDIKYAFCKWIVPRLIALKDTQKGYPGSMTPKQWDKKMQLMIDGFKEGIYEFEDGKCNEKKLEKALILFKDNFEHLWD